MSSAQRAGLSTITPSGRGFPLLGPREVVERIESVPSSDNAPS